MIPEALLAKGLLKLSSAKNLRRLSTRKNDSSLV